MPFRWAWPVWIDWIFIALLWVLGASILAFSGAMGDSNRDLYVALEIAHGHQFPIAGPAIAHRFHYGPLWFYVLAVFAKLTRSWLGIALLSGVLISSVYPMLYLVGRRVAGRHAGLAAAALMALPSFASVYFLVYSHPSLVPAGVALTAWALYSWWDRPCVSRSLVLGLTLSAAIHAHIVNVGLLIPVGLVVVMRGNWRASLLHVVTVGAGTLCLFVPYVIAEALTGFTEFKAGATYAANTDVWTNLLMLPRVWWNGLVLGVPFALANVARVGQVIQDLICIAIGVLGVLAIVGTWRFRRAPWFWIALVGFFSQSVTGIVLRNFTPFYQVLGLLPIIALVMGAGLVTTARKWGAIVACTLTLALLATQWLSQYDVARSGFFRLDVTPIVDLRAVEGPQWVTRWSFPAYARDAYADTVCAIPKTAVAGHLAAAMELSNALDMKLRCPGSPRPISAALPDNRSLTAIEGSMAKSVDLDYDRLGNLFSVSIDVAYQSALTAISDPALYPPRDVDPSLPSNESYSVVLTPSQVLIVVNVPNVWNPGARWLLQCADKSLEPAFEDGDSAAWVTNEVCAGVLTVTAPRPDWVQVFTVHKSKTEASGLKTP